MVGPLVSNQLVMRSGLHDAAFFEDNDSVGFADAAESVRDDDNESVVAKFLNGFVDNAFCQGIESAGGFVEDKDIRAP